MSTTLTFHVQAEENREDGFFAFTSHPSIRLHASGSTIEELQHDCETVVRLLLKDPKYEKTPFSIKYDWSELDGDTDK
jgi:hypothetical protein